MFALTVDQIMFLLFDYKMLLVVTNLHRLCSSPQIRVVFYRLLARRFGFTACNFPLLP